MKQRPDAGTGIDNFIKGSKDEQINDITEKSKRSEDKIDLGVMLSEKPKTFPLIMPPALHKLATEIAAKQFPKVSLHDYILIAIKEKIERES